MSDQEKTDAPAPIFTKKSYKEGMVGVCFKVTAHGWPGATVKAEGSLDLTTVQARELARALVERADEADAKAAKKAAEEKRRREWQNRQIAAGRMKMMTAAEFFGRR